MKRLAFLVPALVVWLLAQPSPRWTIIGPGGGGAQFYPTISPHDSRRVLVACDMTGSYLTEDGGSSWHMFNLRGGIRSFVWDPNDPKVAYALGHGLFRSADGGRTWKILYPPAARITGVEMSSDHGDEQILMDGKPADRVSALAVEPGNSKVLYAAIGSTLQVSSDFGATWRKERDLNARVRRIWAAKGTLYVAGERSISVRENGAWTEGAAAAEPWVDVTAGPPVIYAITASAGSVSEDGGKTWRAFSLPGSGARLAAVAASSQHPEVAYLSFDRLNLDGRNWFGVARTSDRGRTWQLVWQQSQQAPANFTDGWISSRLGPGWGGHALTLGAAPSDPDVCYATDLGRTTRTTDGGKTWTAVYSKPVNNAWTSTGLDVTTAYGVHFDPFDPNHMFISYTDIGLVHSEDRGRSWNIVDGLPRPWRNTTYWIAFDPDVRGRVWGVASATHDLPRPKMWRRTEISRYRGGVIRSVDGGRTWTQFNQGMPETAATHILLDPQSPRDARVLYVAAFGRGVFKSSDGGATWKLENTGIAGTEPFAWRLARDARGGLYLVVARRTEDGSTGTSGDGALYYSSDGAQHWRPVKLPEGVNGPNGLTADPKDPNRLYLAVWGRRGESRAEGSGGVYLSTNAGESWQHILKQDQHVYDVTVDPRNPRTLYACGFESSAWRSTDAGATWQRIPGYNFKWGHRVIPDPADPSQIYITTFGGSVWHGPAAGAAGPVPDLPYN